MLKLLKEGLGEELGSDALRVIGGTAADNNLEGKKVRSASDWFKRLRQHEPVASNSLVHHP